MNIFEGIGRARINRSVFNLSHEHSTAFDMGQLIPALMLEAVPGDIFRMQSQVLVRLMPLVAPAFANMNATLHTFFVPYRILDEDWTDFITKGITGENSYTLPRWDSGDKTVRSLWDYMGFPLNISPDGAEPLDYVRRAYNAIYNEYYRDENLQDEVADNSEVIHIRAWEKDYFTSAFETPQRGTAPAFPISGTTFADFNDVLTDGTVDLTTAKGLEAGVRITDLPLRPYSKIGLRGGSPTDQSYLKQTLNQNVVDFSNATTFDLEDFRWTAVIQQTMERAMRGGVRYTEWLKSMYGTAPRDERLDRPEYIGGSKTPIIISEVLQTSETSANSPQGNLAGHGISFSQGGNGNYRVTEFGIIMGIISILPRAIYHQGIHRQWQRKTPYDFFNPLFANLGEQEIKQSELMATTGKDQNDTIFGFQGMYNEMRYMPSYVTANLRPGQNLEQYTLARSFASPPGLNSDFIQCQPGKRIFAVHRPDEPSFLVSIKHIIKAVRPLPIQPVPGITRI